MAKDPVERLVGVAMAMAVPVGAPLVEPARVVVAPTEVVPAVGRVARAAGAAAAVEGSAAARTCLRHRRSKPPMGLGQSIFRAHTCSAWLKSSRSPTPGFLYTLNPPC